jgi:hypothetical protein
MIKLSVASQPVIFVFVGEAIKNGMPDLFASRHALFSYTDHPPTSPSKAKTIFKVGVLNGAKD